MLFTEAVFITQFLPVVLALSLILQFAGQHMARTLWLVVASIFFYAWFKLDYLPILLGSLLANYFVAKAILRAPGSPTSRRLLIFGIIGNLGLLAIYKYLGFLTFNLNALMAVGLPDIQLLLPLAISFFTFQQISYLVDAHCGKLPAQEHRFLDYMLFVTFFPQLVAGPIVHHAEMMPQFRAVLPVHQRMVLFAEGIFLFACGLFKKLVIADSIAPTADQMFNMVDAGTAINALAAWTGALAYTFQIYFDFSGYSDMAIGLGLLFGIRLPWNFNSPYKATNISEFWRRWHISLSRWLRDYLYVPLGGNRHGLYKQYRNNFATMVLGGLWHGAHWNFIIWGALHGVYLIINQLIRFALRKLGLEDAVKALPHFSFVGMMTTFVGTVIAWVFFRATTTDGALSMLQSMFAVQSDGVQFITVTSQQLILIAIAGLIAFGLPNSRELSERIAPVFKIGVLPLLGRLVLGGMAGSAAALAFVASQSTTQSPFLYFNF